MNKRDFYPSQYVTGHGKTDYFVDVPNGDCQVQIDVRSSKPHTVYLHTSDDVAVAPVCYAQGTHTYATFNVAGLTHIRIAANKDAVVSYRVQHRLRKMADPINDEIVSLPVPPPQIPLATLVSRAVGERLSELTGETNPQIDLEELIDDLPDDVDPEFGPGAMEMDEEFTEKWSQRTKPPVVEDSKPSKPAPTSSPPTQSVQQPAKSEPQADPRIAAIEKLLVELKGN